jgi:hypothetical protein
MVTIYGMKRPQKTTVYLEEADYRALKAIARAKGRTTAALVREAVAEYAARERPRRVPRSLGAGRSRSGDISERAEELLAGLSPRNRRGHS